MPDICMCGAKSGKEHDALCPYPYYGNNAEQESQWMDAWRMKRDERDNTQPIKAEDIRKLNKLFGG